MGVVLILGNFFSCHDTTTQTTGDDTGSGDDGGNTNNDDGDEDALVSFVTFGDWGDESDEQAETADQIGNFCQEEECQFIVTLGDNFQDVGVESVDDPQWETIYSDIYSDLGLPFYAALGNHDMEGEYQAEIDYSEIDSTWHMDNQYYTFTKPDDSSEPAIQFFILNSGDGEFEDAEKNWLISALAASQATWKLVITHRPIISNGDGHGDGHDDLVDRLMPVICDKIDFVLSGHDHIFSYLEGIRDDCEVKQFVIGTGGGDPYGFDESDERAVISGSITGFGWFQASSTELKFKMIETDGNQFYQTSFSK
jgi:acid phosphatase